MYKGNIIRKIILYFIMAIFLVTLSSCRKDSEKKVNNSKNNNEINFQDTINMSLEDEPMEDSQSYLNPSNHSVAKGENGYYFLGHNNQYIMYFDQESQTSIPLCGKADCKHNSLECNAYLQAGKYIWEKIYYYKGYIYLISYGGGNAYLERVNADGSGRQELGEICPYDNKQSSGIDLVFHDDAVYVFDGEHGDINTEYTKVIRKFSLENEEETIFQYTGVNICFLNAKGYGNKLFFVIRNFTYNDGIPNYKAIGLYAYDYNTGKTDQVIDANINDYSIDSKSHIIYYYVNGDGLYKYNLSTKENSRLFEADEDTGSCSISYDGRYIYMNNNSWSNLYRTSFVVEKKDIPKKCLVLDTDGKILNTINCQKISFVYFGDDKFLFASMLSGLDSMVYIDKKDIENATDWTPLVTPIK